MESRPILIVDSDADSLNIYSLVLKHHGYRVLGAADAREGWVIAMREQPQLVLTELFLPQLDGESFVQLLERDERTCDLPVVAITSLPRSELGGSGYSARYAGYLLKPCAPSRLLEEVRQVLAETVERMQSLTGSV